MEPKNDCAKKTKTFLGKKTNKMHKSDETDNSSSIMDTTFELSSDNLLSLEEKSEHKRKIPGLDDIKIPAFLNDFIITPKAKKVLHNYNKIKEELGSSELVKLYLIDIKKIKYQ